MTIPETSLFNNWTHRSLCFELAFLICVFSVAVPLLLFALFLFLLCVAAPVFLLFCLWGPSVFFVGVLCGLCVIFWLCVFPRFVLFLFALLFFLRPVLFCVSFWFVSCVFCVSLGVEKLRFFVAQTDT